MFNFVEITYHKYLVTCPNCGETIELTVLDEDTEENIICECCGSIIKVTPSYQAKGFVYTEV